MQDDCLILGDGNGTTVTFVKNHPKSDSVLMEPENNINIDNEEVNIIEENSKIEIINFISDGTFWAIQENEMQEKYLVHANIYGNVLKSILYSQIKEIGVNIEYGIDDNILIMYENKDDIKYYVYDSTSLENITDEYIGDYDTICDFIETEQGIVFIAKKIEESFEGKYECFKIVDTSGNTIFEISLDKNTLLNEYGIERLVYSGEKVELKCFADNMYYIAYVGDRNNAQIKNSLIIDLNRNNVIPVAFPRSNSGLYCNSDGEYTIVYVSQSGKIRINNNTGETIAFPNEDYDPAGPIREGKFLAEGHWNGNSNEKAILDVNGNLIADLNNYGKSVWKMYPYSDDVAVIEFVNGYMTFISNRGEILFDPVKGNVVKYYEEQCVAVVKNYDNGEVFSIKADGNKIPIELPGDGRPLLA